MAQGSMVAFEKFVSGIERNLKNKTCERAKRKGKTGVGCFSELDCACLTQSKPCLKFNRLQDISDKWCDHPIFIDDESFMVTDHRDDIGGMTHEARIAAWTLYYDNAPVHPFDGEQVDPINEQGQYGRTQLHNAVLNGDLTLCADLIAEGADAELKDNNNQTPYHLAIFEDNDELIAFFEEVGANYE